MKRPQKEQEGRQLSTLDRIFSCFKKRSQPQEISSSQNKIGNKDPKLDSSLNLHYNQAQRYRQVQNKYSNPKTKNIRPEKRHMTEQSNHETQYQDGSSTLKISNKDSRYRLVHGDNFSRMLEARDQVLEHFIDVHIPFNLTQLSQTKFIESDLYKRIKFQIKKFLIESTCNIASIAFGFLNENKLDQKQAKEYASKNIMLNTHTIVKETITAIKENQHTKQRISPEELQELKFHLLVDIDEMLSQVYDNLADYYPQAPAAGGTPRMRDAINDVNRLQDQQNDLIYANKLIINDYLTYAKDSQGLDYLKFREQDQYTDFIMKVINTAIRVTQSNEQDSRQRTVKQIFTQFNQQLFCLAENQHFQTIVHNLGLQGKKDDQILKKKQRVIKKDIGMFFGLTLERDGQKVEELSQKFLEKEENLRENSLQLEVSHIRRKGNSNEQDKLLKILQGIDQSIQEQKKTKRYLIGQKIPGYVREFNKKELLCKEFSSKHSSILRILTKWNEYLEDIFENAEKHIRQRLYPFKTVNNELVTLTLNDWGGNGRSQLIEQLNQEYREVKNKEKIILKSSYEWMSHLLTQSQEENTNVARYSSTRTIASKINAVLTSLTLEYTNTLIHHLLKAGRNMKTDKGYQNINLVVFRVSDLLRSKLQCSESSFINLLRTLYLLDNSEAMRGKFKLVRIKNKLDNPANNIIVNYLLMGKVQCELQLSIQESKGKQKNYEIFSHFIYELMRGKFGSIAQCSIMISQLDPLITACKQRYYVQKQQPSKMIKQLKGCPVGIKKTSDSNKPESHIEKNIDNKIFECRKCKKLIINQSLDIFQNREKGSSRVCNGCNISQQNPEKKFKRTIKGFPLRQYLSQELQAKKITRIFNYKQFSNLQHEKCIAILSDQGQLNLNVVIRIEQELKTFFLKVNNSVLTNIFNENLDFSSLDYIDITKKIRKHHKSQLLMYMIEDIETLSPQLYLPMDVDKKMFNTRLKNVIDLFREFRKEKTLIKAIKFKAEIIDTNDNDTKWTILDKINRELVLKERVQNQPPLKYTKYHHLDLLNLKQLEAKQVAIEEIPHWLAKCTHLNILSMERNSIKSIKEGQLPSSLTVLKLASNYIAEINLSNLKNLVTLDLRQNNIRDIDLTHLTCLTSLYLSKNKLEVINLNTLSSLTVIYLEFNLLNGLKFLPKSLEELSADKKAVFDFDFRGMDKLKKVHVWNGWNKNRDTLINLRQGVVILENK